MCFHVGLSYFNFLVFRRWQILCSWQCKNLILCNIILNITVLNYKKMRLFCDSCNLFYFCFSWADTESSGTKYQSDHFFRRARSVPHCYWVFLCDFHSLNCACDYAVQKNLEMCVMQLYSYFWMDFHLFNIRKLIMDYYYCVQAHIWS